MRKVQTLSHLPSASQEGSPSVQEIWFDVPLTPCTLNSARQPPAPLPGMRSARLNVPVVARTVNATVTATRKRFAPDTRMLGLLPATDVKRRLAGVYDERQ